MRYRAVMDTFSIDQLIEELQRQKTLHGGDTKVLATWEGTIHAIGVKRFEYNEACKSPHGDDDPPVLYIDVD